MLPEGLHLHCSLATLQREEAACPGAPCCLLVPTGPGRWLLCCSGVSWTSGTDREVAKLLWHCPFQQCSMHLEKFNERGGGRERAGEGARAGGRGGGREGETEQEEREGGELLTNWAIYHTAEAPGKQPTITQCLNSIETLESLWAGSFTYLLVLFCLSFGVMWEEAWVGIRAGKRGGWTANNSGAYINPDMEAGETSKCPQTGRKAFTRQKRAVTQKTGWGV